MDITLLRVFGGIFTLLLLGVSLHCEPHPYIAEGTCDFNQFTSSKVKIFSEQWAFRIAVSSSNWVLHLTSPQYDNRRISGDDRTCLFFTDFTKSLAAQIKNGYRVGSNTAGGLVISRPVPNVFTYTPSGVVWLTYASQNYFKLRKSPGLVEVPSGVGTSCLHDVDFYGATKRAQWELGETGLPLKVVYYEGGALRSRMAADGTYTLSPLAKPFDQGFRNSDFEVFETMAQKDESLPAKARFVTYSPEANATSSNDLWIKYEFLVNATNVVTDIRPADLDVSFTGLTLINDARFIDDLPHRKRPFAYFARTKLPPESVVKSLPEYSASPPPPIPSLKQEPSVIYNLVVFCSAIAAIMLVPRLSFPRIFSARIKQR